MDASIKKILEIVTDLQDRQGSMEKRMATKDDIQNLQTQINENTRAIGANTRAIEAQSESIRDIRGYATEIDHLMTRMKAVERHVGI